VRALGRGGRVALAVATLAVLAAFAGLIVRREASNKSYSQHPADARQRGLDPIPFHFDYSSKLRLSKPAGAYVQIERRIGGTLAGRFTVSPMRIGRQRGLVSGFLPILAGRYEQSAERRFDGFRLQFEGRARVNQVEGYQFAFGARLPRHDLPPRQLFGRVVMLPEPLSSANPEVPYPPGRNPTRGLLITMLATTLEDVPSATRVGDAGILRGPFRSFLFGG
jgi:hypothetical protein